MRVLGVWVLGTLVLYARGQRADLKGVDDARDNGEDRRMPSEVDKRRREDAPQASQRKKSRIGQMPMIRGKVGIRKEEQCASEGAQQSHAIYRAGTSTDDFAEEPGCCGIAGPGCARMCACVDS